MFRVVLPAPDLPQLTFQNGVAKHVPNQHGTNRIRDEITTRWQVNANGWTSSISEYRRTKTPGTYRIAVIGDSYVQGLSVQPTEHVAEQLQQALHDPSIEVYRFTAAARSLRRPPPRVPARLPLARAEFNFESDYHWNRRGHAVAAAAIKDLLMGTGLVPSSHRVSS